MCIFLTSSHSWKEAQCTNLFFRRSLLFSGGCSRPTKQTIYSPRQSSVVYKGLEQRKFPLFHKQKKVFQVSTNLHFLSLPHAKLLIARRPSNTFVLIDITLHVGFSDTENHSGDFIFLLVVAPALDNSVSTENFSIAADGDASEVRTHVLRMKISYPDRLDDGAEYSGL